jgi:very-short-patch-repair endonuclease
MTKVFNKTSIKEKRRILRKNMTKAEALLCLKLKNKQICNSRFLRQYSVESFILDFYCPKHHLAIEVDGLTHITKEEIEYDKIRQTQIEKYGIDFLRFTNAEVYGNINFVLETIKSKIAN